MDGQVAACLPVLLNGALLHLQEVASAPRPPNRCPRRQRRSDDLPRRIRHPLGEQPPLPGSLLYELHGFVRDPRLPLPELPQRGNEPKGLRIEDGHRSCMILRRHAPRKGWEAADNLRCNRPLRGLPQVVCAADRLPACDKGHRGYSLCVDLRDHQQVVHLP